MYSSHQVALHRRPAAQAGRAAVLQGRRRHYAPQAVQPGHQAEAVHPGQGAGGRNGCERVQCTGATGWWEGQGVSLWSRGACSSRSVQLLKRQGNHISDGEGNNETALPLKEEASVVKGRGEKQLQGGQAGGGGRGAGGNCVTLLQAAQR